MCKNKAGTEANRFELKTVDATANPYMALGAFIAAGLDGLRPNLVLPEETAIDPGLIPEDQRRAKGIDLLPQNLGQALDALRKDNLLLEAMGEQLAGSYMAVRRNEWENLKDLTLEEEVALLAERY